VIRSAPLELGECRRGIFKIAFGPRQRRDVLVTFGAQVVDERGPHQASGAGHKNSI
jgi:hypothetical protein